MIRIGVVDGQGGGVGSLIVKKLRETFGDDIEIYALGTNSAATVAMMKARANKGATGENAIMLNAERMDVIIGPLSVVLANAMLGELTPGMAEAIATSPARKILLPISQEEVEVIGVVREPLPHLVDKLIERVKEVVGQKLRS